MMRSCLIAAALLATGYANAQYYLKDTAFTTHIGSGGAKASAISRPLGTNYGINMNRNSAFLIGEDFTVPTGQTWNLDTVVVYSYQTLSPTTSPFTGATLQITSGSVTGAVIFGDTSTNKLVASGWTNIYRVDTAAGQGGVTSTQRPIMYLKLKVTPTKTLTAGTYWLEYGALGNSSFTGPWGPPKVSPGMVNPTGQNGMQRTPTRGWIPAKDSTSPTAQQNLGFPFLLKGPSTTGVYLTTLQADFGLQNFPNPVTRDATISFTLRDGGPAKLNVYNSAGQLVRTMLDGEQRAGKQQVILDASSLPGGTYYYKLQTQEGEQTKTLQILK